MWSSLGAEVHPGEAARQEEDFTWPRVTATQLLYLFFLRILALCLLFDSRQHFIQIPFLWKYLFLKNHLKLQNQRNNPCTCDSFDSCPSHLTSMMVLAKDRILSGPRLDTKLTAATQKPKV